MSWIEDSQNNKYPEYVVLEETLTLPDSDGATETTVDSSTIKRFIGDRKFLCQIEVTEASAGNGSINAKLRASIYDGDESEWVDVDADLGIVVDNTSLGAKDAAFFDAMGFEAPQWQIQLFSDGTDTLDDATIKVTIAFLG